MCDCITKEIFRTIGSGVPFVVGSVVDQDPEGSASFCQIRISIRFNPGVKLNFFLFQKIPIWCPKYRYWNYDTYDIDGRDNTK